MRKHPVIAVVVLASSLACFAAPEGEQPPPRTISVSGSAVGYVPADTVVWTVTLDSTGKDLLDAKEQSDQQVKALLDVCKQKGIQGPDVDVGIIRIEDARTSDTGGYHDPSKIFKVTRVVTLRQRDLRQFASLLEMLSRGRSMRVRYNIVSSKTDEITRETLVKATHAAKDKAAAMVGILGARLGNLLTINEYPPSDWQTPDESVPVDQGSSAFGADAEKVRITVYATFEIQ